MKKQIPKFDQKAWDEKQAKVSDEANGKSSSGFDVYIGGQKIAPSVSGVYDVRVRGNFPPGLLPILSVPKDKLAAQYPPMGNRVTVTNDPIFISPTGMATSKYDPDTGRWIISDAYDQFLFGGDSEDTMELPKGYFDQTGFDWASTGASNPAKTNCDLGIHEYVNVGFHHDILVCKHCDKAKE